MAMSSLSAPDQTDFARQRAALANLWTRQTLFFVGGYPKSGTTWLQVLLNAHPEVSCIGEGHLPNHLLPLLRQATDQHDALIAHKNATVLQELPGFPRFTDDQVSYLLATAISLLLLVPAKAATAHAVGERTPDNYLHFPELAALFPTARFIHIVRDGRDCATSAWFHNERLGADEQAREFASIEAFIEPLAEHWSTAVAESLAWCEAQPARCMVVRYEDLVDQPTEALRRLFGFLGVATTDDVIAHCQQMGAFETLSQGRKVGQEDRTSLFRRGLPGDWRNHFSARDNAKYLAIAGDLTARLGYR
jgi:hypothetical protein